MLGNNTQRWIFKLAVGEGLRKSHTSGHLEPTQIKTTAVGYNTTCTEYGIPHVGIHNPLLSLLGVATMDGFNKNEGN